MYKFNFLKKKPNYKKNIGDKNFFIRDLNLSDEPRVHKPNNYYILDKNLNIKKANNMSKKIETKNIKPLPLANTLNIGYYLLTPILFGVFVGLMIDKWLKTNNLATIICIFIGLISSIYNLIKIVKDTSIS